MKGEQRKIRGLQQKLQRRDMLMHNVRTTDYFTERVSERRRNEQRRQTRTYDETDGEREREKRASKVLQENKNSCSVHNDRFHHHHYHSFRMYLYDNKKVRRVYKEVREEFLYMCVNVSTCSWNRVEWQRGSCSGTVRERHFPYTYKLLEEKKQSYQPKVRRSMLKNFLLKYCI